MIGLVKYLPKNYLSYLVGMLTAIELPRFLLIPLLRWYIKRYGVRVEEADKELSSYRSLAEFFTRDLRPGLRPIEGDLVCPVDGTLRSYGLIDQETISDVKGQDYSVGELLKRSSLAGAFTGGAFVNLYLAPGDYHHVHSPVSGEISDMLYIPGKLWPVNDWSLSNVPGLFVQNERILVLINSRLGRVGVVLVGATNVGKISLAFDRSIVGNQLSLLGRRCGEQYPFFHKSYAENIPVNVGDRLGTFNFGSSVILLFEPGVIKFPLSLHSGQKVRYGLSLVRNT